MSEQRTTAEGEAQAKREGPDPAPLLGENIKRVSAEWAAKMKAVPEQTRQAFDKALQDLVDILRKGLEAAGDELAARHFDRPRSIEDWKHLALIVEIPPEKIGDLTLGEIYDCAPGVGGSADNQGEAVGQRANVYEARCGALGDSEQGRQPNGMADQGDTIG